ncbi:hypothetical protein SY89_00167 [Halolamina pelagica]|uniref:Uncharacterized protein n=1 Tax=Halolamina pelagica TaxID=699431 RepID=A0A0P7H7S3_9EURY|nr:hypothetical protein [Halolamina pelagica]KPN29454.1 hypothetical protein SY89_00167 [Halolamina pelagica]
MGPRKELKDKLRRRTNRVADADANGTAAVGLRDPEYSAEVYAMLDFVEEVERACPEGIEIRVYVKARPSGVDFA